MPTNLILSGGAVHDFAATSAALAGVLAEAGVESVITEEIPEGLPATDLLTVNALRHRTTRVPEATRSAIRAHLGAGRGILAVHTASICFDDWPEWGQIVGAAWNWDRSWHPPLGPVKVTVGPDEHPVTAGVTDFELTDEVYSDLDLQPGLVPLASANGRPLLWAREVGGGRVVYDALGHDTRSYAAPHRRRWLRQAALWLLEEPGTIAFEE